MNKLLFAFLIFIFMIPSCKTEPSAPDAEQMVMATLWFQHSGEARALYYQAYNLAELRVRQALDTLPDILPKAVIADIDETILDNSPSEGKNILEGNRYSAERWKTWTNNRSATRLPGSLEFAVFLESVGVDLYYISNRSVDELNATLDNLKKLGYPFADAEHILLKSDQSTKTPRRQSLAKNHHIILLLGDNLNDFSDIFEDRSQAYGFETVDNHSEEFGNRFILLPNPMYGSWTKPIFGSTSGMSPKETASKRKSFIIGY